MLHVIADRITVDPDQLGGHPCIRGMRLRVVDGLELLAAGLTFQEVLDEMPDLEVEDLSAALKFAASRIDHPIVVAA
ncbi:MAG: DUF433 domain-containing protein [Anaerolineae bacterium]|nr:DUF433 domain-containing protein [Anaerolineae bacterium]